MGQEHPGSQGVTDLTAVGGHPDIKGHLCDKRAPTETPKGHPQCPSSPAVETGVAPILISSHMEQLPTRAGISLS